MNNPVVTAGQHVWTPRDLKLTYYFPGGPACINDGSGNAIAMRNVAGTGNGGNFKTPDLDAANRPLISGREVVFDASNDEFASIGMPYTTNKTVAFFYLVKVNGAGYHNLFDGSNMLWVDPSLRLEMDAGGLVTTATIPTGQYISIVGQTSNVSGCFININGTGKTGGNNSNTGVDFSMELFGRGGSQTFNGRMVECGFRSTAWSSGDIALLEKYLMAKKQVL